MLSLFSYSSHMYSVSDFLLNPIFLHGIMGFLHLVLLLTLFVSWVRKKITVSTGNSSKQKFNGHTLYKKTLLCSLGVFGFNLILCLYNFMNWKGNYWSDEKLVTLLDIAVSAIAWGVFCVYSYNLFVNSDEKTFPLFFRIWCCIYLIISCYCFIVDIILYEQQVTLPIQYLVSDAVSVFSGLIFGLMGVYAKNKSENEILEEPLLNGNQENTPNLSTKGSETITPYSKAGIFSILTFSWMGPLIAVGNKKTLDLEDVPQLASSNSAFGTFPSFKNRVEADCGTISRVTVVRLMKLLILSAWKEIVLTAILATLNTLACYVGPFLIDTFVQYLNGHREFKNEGYLLVSAFFVAKLTECLSQRHFFFKFYQVGIKIRAILVTVIYNKGLTLPCQSKQGQSTGEIINFMAVDAERIGDFTWHIVNVWIVLLNVTLALSILYKNLGIASVAAFVTTVIVMLGNVPLGSLQERFQNKLMESKDRRMKATSEILRSMRILKLQGWELRFLSKITEMRKTEEGWLKKYVYTSAMTTFVFWIAPTFVSVITFCACMLVGIPLESGKILSALATFRILQESINSLPETISMIAEIKVSLDRIVSFLRIADLNSNAIEKLPRGSTNKAIEITNGHFSWDLDLSSQNTTLRDINLTVLHGMSVAVCGTVGSGKSSLLSCILGEVPKVQGRTRVCGSMAYVAQSPWIQSGTIEENILFGKEMDRERYEKVLQACSLKKDLEILSFGDQTVIGERGINLSGGQKQRIQIVRALYQDADIYLLDDPFSAVDAHTGSHLFKATLFSLVCSS